MELGAERDRRRPAEWLRFFLFRASKQRKELPEAHSIETFRVRPSRVATRRYETALHEVDRTAGGDLLRLWREVFEDLSGEEVLEAEIVRPPGAAPSALSEPRKWDGQVLIVEDETFSVELTSDDDDADEVIRLFFISDVPQEYQPLVRPDARLRLEEVAGPGGEWQASFVVYPPEPGDPDDIAAASSLAEEVAAAFVKPMRPRDAPE